MLNAERLVGTAAPAAVAIPDGIRIAVILPCYNEEVAIAGVVRGFRTALPNAEIYVFDNASSDRTIANAETAGAVIRTELARGKGNVVRRAFADVDADVYVLADGDGTYDAARAPELIERLLQGHFEMVVGVRKADRSADAYRAGHRFGNWLFSRSLKVLFHGELTDVFSGYRVLSRRFVKSFPALSEGFEIETELTAHALRLRLPIDEVETRYFERVAGTESKLSTIRDGFRILWTVLLLTKQYRPFLLYGLLAAALAILSLALGMPVVEEFLETGLVPRLPTALLATGIMLLAGLSFVTGLVLHSISRNAIETKRLFYLALPVADASGGSRGAR